MLGACDDRRAPSSPDRFAGQCRNIPFNVLERPSGAVLPSVGRAAEVPNRGQC